MIIPDELQAAMEAVRKMDPKSMLPGLSVEGWKGSRIHLLFLAAAALVCLEGFDAPDKPRGNP